MSELIVLVDDEGRPIGQAPKLESHHANTPLHLAFSCFLFNEKGDFLLTRRAESKKVWPGVWTGSVCGHPAPGESFEDAIKRRCEYELGIVSVSDITKACNYRYITPIFNGVIENEICPIFFARFVGPIRLNESEVEEYKLVKYSEIGQLISSEPSAYSFWFKDQQPYVLEALSRLKY